MTENRKAELVFIPSPGRGHLMATVEMAKLLVERDEGLSVTMLVIKPFSDSSENQSSSHQNTLESNNSMICFIDLQQPESPLTPTTSPIAFLNQYIEGHKDQVRHEVAKIQHCSRLAGFVVDIFCTNMIDMANELGVPSYVFFTSGAASLGVMFHLQRLRDHENQDLSQYKNAGIELLISSYKHPLPAKLLPAIMFHKDGCFILFNHAKKIRETKGILINTFLELESLPMESLSIDETIPPVYPIGPIIHVNGTDGRNSKYAEIMTWLDEQPNSSVVFICFGSEGYFDEPQVKEIALALERSGHRFLWSLRKPPTENFKTPGEYENPEEVLPEGFLERTLGFGMVIGWAPQMTVLSHAAIGGFVSHCGWNSILESIWCGVPIAVWPVYAEQHLNAFELVKDLGLAVEIKMDYMKDNGMIVTADDINNGIKRLMEPASDVRVKFEAMKVKSRMALEKGGSSFDFVGRFIENVIDNIP